MVMNFLGLIRGGKSMKDADDPTVRPPSVDEVDWGGSRHALATEAMLRELSPEALLAYTRGLHEDLAEVRDVLATALKTLLATRREMERLTVERRALIEAQQRERDRAQAIIHAVGLGLPISWGMLLKDGAPDVAAMASVRPDDLDDDDGRHR
jgi:hypothetical protein